MGWSTVLGTLCALEHPRCPLREERGVWEEASVDKRSSVPCGQALWGHRAETEDRMH